MEALRRAAASAWQPELLPAAEAYAQHLVERGKAPIVCVEETHVVFDLYDEDDDDFDEAVETDELEGAFLAGGAMHAANGAGVDSAMYDFLQAVGLASIGRPLGDAQITLPTCVDDVTRDRTAFLAKLRDAGVSKLADRQALANALLKASRAGWLRPPFKGPFTEAGRELRRARDANPGAANPALGGVGAMGLPVGTNPFFRAPSSVR